MSGIIIIFKSFVGNKVRTIFFFDIIILFNSFIGNKVSTIFFFFFLPQDPLKAGAKGFV